MDSSPLVIAIVAVLITLLYASVLDIRDRRVPFRTWYPMLAVGIPAAGLWYYLLINGGLWPVALFYLVLTVFFSAVFYAFASFNLFGGADAWALIFLSICVPAFPIIPLPGPGGISPLGFFPFTVLVNAVILNLLTPLALFIRNIIAREKAPLIYLFLGYPVPGSEITRHFGFLIQEVFIEGSPGGIAGSQGDTRGKQVATRFIPVRSAMKGLMKGGRRLYTRDLREYPEEYRDELSLIRKADKVWISYGVPFIVPIAAGVITALLVGDFVTLLLGFLKGG